MEPAEVLDSKAFVAAAPRVGHYRWLVCALLFTAATVNYVDRQVIGVLKPLLQHDLGYTEVDYGNIVTAFQAAYAIGMLTMGRLMDRLGTRRGFSIAVCLWSLAAAAHALASTVTGFSIARFALGFGEAGMFPASLKTIAEWFPKQERALATGIFNSGTNIGAIVCPLVVPWLASRWGWQAAFVVTGSIGGLWVLLWLVLYVPLAQNQRVSAAERAYIVQGNAPQGASVRWRALLPHRQTWAYAIAKFLTDPFWWLYLFWIPDFLHKRHGLNLLQVGAPLVVIYLLSDIGSIAGGWLSSRMMALGFGANRARKTALLVCALAVTPILFASRVAGLWQAVFLIGLATAAHQGFSANLFTLSTDLFPARAVGSAVGIGGLAGAVGGMLIAQVAGHILSLTGSYTALFACAAFAYLGALTVIHVLAPTLTPVEFEPSPQGASHVP
ncbi:MAG TPA: MFS transporter [Polyangiaceae bacterium]|jgi:ACS family hexuronate transporter-like MFS transporter|nr:MFS transporter [Polyangiaceae bacterium]